MTFDTDGTISRGTGGLVTALTAWPRTARSRGSPARWAAATRPGRQAGGKAFTSSRPSAATTTCGWWSRTSRPTRASTRSSQPDAVVHPALPVGPVQRPGHPHPRGRGLRLRLQARQRGHGRRRGRGDRRRRGPGRDGPRLPPVPAAGDDPRAGRTSSSTTSSTSRGRSRTPGACCPRGCARRSTAASWPTTSSASTPAPTGATSCSAARTCWSSRSTTSGRRQVRRPRGLGPRLPAADRRAAPPAPVARRARVRQFEDELLRRRRDS